MAISNTEAQKLRDKFKRSLKGEPPAPLPSDFSLDGLAEAVKRVDLVYVNKSLSKALREGVLQPCDLWDEDSGSDMHTTLGHAKYGNTSAGASEKPRQLFNAWEAMAKMGMAQQAAKEIETAADGFGPSLTATQLARKAFLDSVGRYAGLEYHDLEIGNNPAPGIHRIGFRLNQIANWQGDVLENAAHPVDVNEQDPENEGDLMRVRLGDHGYVEMLTGSYYDDERTHDYTMGVFTIGQTADALSRFIQTRRPLVEIESFFLDAKNDAAAMVTKIEAGMPVDVRSENSYQSQRALSMACSFQNEDAIVELLKRHANPSRGPGETHSPLGCLLDSSKGHNVFWSTGKEEEQTLKERETGMRCLKHLIDAGANVSELASNFRDATPLMIACRYRNTEVFSMLLKAGADTQVKNSKGVDVFEYAREHKADNICALLDGWKATQAIERSMPKKNTNQPT